MKEMEDYIKIPCCNLEIFGVSENMNEPAEIKGPWLEVKGSKNVDRGRRYNVGFKISFAKDANGWDDSPLHIMATLGEKGEYHWKKIDSSVFAVKEEGEKTIEIDIDVPNTSADPTIHFALYEVWTGIRKTGMRIHHAFLKPGNRIMEGQKTVFKASELKIIHGENPQYWQLPSKDTDEPATLLNVCWLEVNKEATVEPGKKYDVGFTISFRENSSGWNASPVYITANIGSGADTFLTSMKEVDFKSAPKGGEKFDILGNFVIYIPEDCPEPKLNFTLRETWTNQWKRGLQIYEGFVKEIGS